MDVGKCSAYNETRHSELCSEATVIDSAQDPLRVLKVLIEGLDPDSEEGIYLKNFSGVPVAGALSSFDLVYLDQRDRVMQGVELSPDFEAAPFTGRAVAALVLPSGTIARSRTATGDALTVTVVKVAERAAGAAKPAESVSSADWLSRSRPAEEQAAAAPESQIAPELAATAQEAEEATPDVAVTLPEEVETEPEPVTETAGSAEPAATGSDDEQLILVIADEVVGEPEVVSVETAPEPSVEEAEHEPEEVVEQATAEPSRAGEDSGQEHVALPPVAAMETAELSGKPDSLEEDLRRLVAQKLDEKGKAKKRGKNEPLEEELRRLVSARGNRLKRIQLWTSSVFARGFTGSPARTRALKASQLGPVDWVGDQPRRAADASAAAGQKKQTPAPDEPLKIRFLRRIDYFLRWLNYEEDLGTPIFHHQASEQRRGDRLPFPNMIAFFWTGGVPKPYKIGNISVSGFYLITDDRWSPGTVIRMTLQRGNTTGDDPRDTITVFARVVRWGPDGEGFEFVLTKLLE